MARASRHQQVEVQHSGYGRRRRGGGRYPEAVPQPSVDVVPSQLLHRRGKNGIVLVLSAPGDHLFLVRAVLAELLHRRLNVFVHHMPAALARAGFLVPLRPVLEVVFPGTTVLAAPLAMLFGAQVLYGLKHAKYGCRPPEWNA